MPQERRREPRIRVTAPDVECATPGRPRNCARALLDLSRHGAQVYLHEPLEPGEKVILWARIPRLPHDLRVNGQIRWCRRGPSLLTAGILFTDVPVPTREILSDLERWFDA